MCQDLSSEPVFEDVETFCPVTRAQVVLSLRVANWVAGDLVSGAPVSCNCEVGCSCGVGCLLRSIRVCTYRRKLK